MSTSRSENHYFRHGDITILVDNTLFKLHQDILETHSEYFQSELNSAEPGDGQAFSDEHPWVFPENTCSAETFDIVCDFLYPKAIGEFPVVLIKEMETWECVLRASVSLRIRGLQEHILTNFKGDVSNDPISASRLLGLAVRYEEASNSLKLQCLYALVFLRRAFSPAEFTALGATVASQVIAIRDRIRVVIITSHTFRITIHRHYLCVEGPKCQTGIHEGIYNNIKDADPLLEYYQTNASIFDIPHDSRICFHCNSIRAELARTMAKQDLEGEIRRCAAGLGLIRAEE